MKIDQIFIDIFTNMQDGVIISDNADSIIQINESAKMMFNIENGNIPDLKISDLVPDYCNKKYYHNFELAPSLYKKYILLSQADINQNGIKSGKIIIARDITNQKLLEETWHKFEFIVDTAKEFMTLVRNDYTTIIINKFFCNAIGKKHEDIINKPISLVWEKEVFNNLIKKHFHFFWRSIIKF